MLGEHKATRSDRREARYRAAVGRQLLMHDRFDAGVRISRPAPAERLLRRGDTLDSCDFRSYAGAITRDCADCGQLIHWIECPTGSWWAHVQHPQDEHDATPALTPEGTRHA